jgi:tetratricopeptide (TPR) repeat protein
MLRLTLVFAIAALFAQPLRAQDSSLEEAKAHAARAKVHYDLGEFEKAAEEYIQVYRIKPLPALLYNIAQSYRQAGQYEKAKQFYKSYLREAKDATASNRAAVEKAIREIEELQAKEKRAKDGPPKGIALTPPVTGGAPTLAPPPAGTAPQAGAAAAPAPASTAVAESLKPPAGTAAAAPAAGAAQAGTAPARTPLPPEAVAGATVQPSSSKRRTYAYISAGAAAVFIGGGLAFLSKASKYEDELNARPHPQVTIDDLSSTAKSSRTIGAVLLGAGLAAGVGAGLLYFLPSGDGVAVQGRF